MKREIKALTTRNQNLTKENNDLIFRNISVELNNLMNE